MKKVHKFVFTIEDITELLFKPCTEDIPLKCDSMRIKITTANLEDGTLKELYFEVIED